MADSPRKYQHRPIPFKRQIVEASRMPGTSVAALAQQYGINANQVWAWRKLYNEGRLDDGSPALLAVEMMGTGSTAHTVVPLAGCLASAIGQARLSVTGTVDPAMLQTAIAALLR